MSQFPSKTEVSLGVLGDGTMGWQISLLAASKGFNVLLIGKGNKKEKLCKRTEKILKVTSDNLNINYSNDICLLKDIPIIIETLPENLELKLDFIKLLISFKNNIICTNTSSLDLNKLLIEPSRICALHFINPVNSYKFVEFSCLEEFEPNKQTIRNFINTFQYDLFECPPTTGLVLNRLLFSYLDTVRKLRSEGVDSDICDEIFNRLTGANLNTNKIMKLIGLNLCDSIFENLKTKSYLPK